MPLETGLYISDLNTSNPAATDGLGQADDHFRLIKSTVKNTFPNIDGPVTASEDALNAAATAATDGTSKLDDDGAFFAADSDTGVVRPSADSVALKAGGTNSLVVTPTGIGTPGAYSGGSGQLVPTGTILDYAGDTEPTGYLFPYGQAVSRTTYSALFAVIGTTYGAGDGSTTFNLPDVCGRVVAGRDDMGGVSKNRLTGQTDGVNGDTLGGAGGKEEHALTADEAPELTGTTASAGAHTHTIFAQSINLETANTNGIATPYLRTTTNNLDHTTASSGAHTHSVTVNSDGGGAHNNVQPTIILNKIIKT